MRREPKFTDPHANPQEFDRREKVWLGPHLLGGGIDSDLYYLEKRWMLCVWGRAAYASAWPTSYDRSSGTVLTNVRYRGLLEFCGPNTRGAGSKNMLWGVDLRQVQPVLGVNPEEAAKAMVVAIRRLHARGVLGGWQDPSPYERSDDYTYNIDDNGDDDEDYDEDDDS